jgi:hypothetical protein
VEGQQALGNRGRNKRGPSQEHDEGHQESWLQNPIMLAVGAQSLRLTAGIMTNIDDAFSGAGKVAGSPQYPRYNTDTSYRYTSMRCELSTEDINDSDSNSDPYSFGCASCAIYITCNI